MRKGWGTEDAETNKVSMVGDAESNDSGPVYCEYIFIVHLPNITFTLQVKESG